MQFVAIETHVDNVVGALPALSLQCQQFLEQAKALNEQRHSITLTLQHHTQIIELLELPLLMDTCVRKGMYDEALMIQSHTQRLSKKHPELPLINV